MGDPVSSELPRFLTVAAAAQRYGFKSALACKRFCLRNAVPIRCVGKLRFVAPADLEALIAGERPSTPAPAGGARVDDCAAALMGGR